MSINFERWKALADLTSKEQDPEKLMQLANEMNRKESRPGPFQTIVDRVRTAQSLKWCALLLSLGTDLKLCFPIMEHPTNHEPTEEEWRKLARQAAGEEDPDTQLSIVQRLLVKFDEWKSRLGSPTRDLN
jgi:hypothetical protein